MAKAVHSTASRRVIDRRVTTEAKAAVTPLS